MASDPLMASDPVNGSRQASPILVGGISPPGRIRRLESRSLDLVGQTVAPENNMAQVRAQGARKKRGHGI
jgi:hypothetical protein